jgi:uncharacterized membrane protein YtjA (UPF0391 family)
MLGWMIIFAILALLGFGMSQGSDAGTIAAGYSLFLLFGVLFSCSILIRKFSRHSS